ncbi:MAG: hypothetical protein KDC34_02265 [Saprospiraceae bacterium]|nr:hypothetical protein [Saprospiraceae bacterium]
MDEFYIGWQADPTPSYKRKKLQGFWLLLAIAILAAGIIAFAQGPFSTASFEYGSPRELSGVLERWPVPSLVIHQQDGAVESQQRILLVDAGKRGAAPLLDQWEKTAGKSLDKHTVRLAGTLIYFDGKAVLELTQGEKALLETGEEQELEVQYSDRQRQTLLGEILDSKCFFGVMKPAEGKPHKSCAVRCLSGGIPAVFKARGSGDTEEYFLILDADGQPANSLLLDYTGEPIALCGESVLYNDWQLFYLDKEQPIRRLGPPGSKLPTLCATSR